MLRFTSMTIHNCGPYAGTQKIEFGNDDGVTLIWGDNGHGKTTLLNLFRYALFGRFQHRHETVQDILKLVNKEGASAGDYGFKIILDMVLDGKNYQLTRQYTPREGVTEPKTNNDYRSDVFLSIDGDFCPNTEHELALIMPEEVSRFFLFDGELLQEYEELLKDDTVAGNKIKSSIESILGVPILMHARTDAEAVLEQYRIEQTKAAQASAQTREIASKIQMETASKEEQVKQLKQLQDEYEQVKDDIARIEDEAKRNEYLNQRIQDMKYLENNIDSESARREKILEQIKISTKDIWKYLIAKKTPEVLKAVNEELSALEQSQKNHESSKLLIQLVQEVISTGHCNCCNQDVDSEHIEILKQQISAMQHEMTGLSPEEMSRLKSLRMRKASLEAISGQTDSMGLESYEQQLADVTVEIDDNKAKLKELRSEIGQHGNIEDLAQSTSKQKTELLKCYTKANNLEKGIQETKAKIDGANKALARLEEILRHSKTSDPNLSLVMEKIKVCGSIVQLFNDGITAYREKLKSRVEKDASELFRRISNDRDYTSLKINDNYGLSIQHRSGEIIPFPSAGFEHIVALSLIGALHKNAPLSGPIIMDSPFGRLDPTHKQNITKILPLMSDQIILLAYTDEIDAQTARASLGSTLKREYRLVKYSSFHTEIELQ